MSDKALVVPAGGGLKGVGLGLRGIELLRLWLSNCGFRKLDLQQQKQAAQQLVYYNQHSASGVAHRKVSVECTVMHALWVSMPEAFPERWFVMPEP